MWRWWLVTITFESACDCHHHFFKVEFAIFQAILSFCGLKYAEHAIAAGAPPRTPLGELTTLPRLPSRPESGHPSPYPTATRRLDARAFGASIVVPPDTKSWRRHWSPPRLSKVKLRQCFWSLKRCGHEPWCPYTCKISRPKVQLVQKLSKNRFCGESI